MTAQRTAITVASAAAIAMAVPAVKQYEGLWLTAKVDRIGTGQPVTGGYGETENVKLGETHTEAYWAARLGQRLPEYDRKIGACIKVELPDSARASLVSAAYNAGPGAVCKSPMVALMNAGKVREGCEALKTWYIRARGVVVQGLINRRANERKLCLSGLNKSKAAPLPAARPIVATIAAPKPACAWWRKCA